MTRVPPTFHFSSIYRRSSADLNPLNQLSFSKKTKPVQQPGCYLLSTLYWLWLSPDHPPPQRDRFSSLRHLLLFAGLIVSLLPHLNWPSELSDPAQERAHEGGAGGRERRGFFSFSSSSSNICTRMHRQLPPPVCHLSAPCCGCHCSPRSRGSCSCSQLSLPCQSGAGHAHKTGLGTPARFPLSWPKLFRGLGFDQVTTGLQWHQSALVGRTQLRGTAPLICTQAAFSFPSTALPPRSLKPHTSLTVLNWLVVSWNLSQRISQ